MADAAVIFDVDGVLLELTREEEELFFQPFAKHCDASLLSRDWNSYKIRNDEDIIKEICERFEIEDYETIKHEYLRLLNTALHEPSSTRHSRKGGNVCSPAKTQMPASAGVTSLAIAGAAELLNDLAPHATLGIATANFREAAKLRLEQAGLWHHVAAHAFGADGGGHKQEILGRAVASLNLPNSRIVYIGDSVNDVEAGLKNGVHFIGSSACEKRLEELEHAGAKHLSSSHQHTRQLIHTLLSKDTI